MKRIPLLPAKPSSALGFGCAPILGAVGPERARAAIHLALDLGVNHFDLARSYGYGEAERFVGSLLRGRRDEVVLASKFGIRATPLAALMRPLKPLVRALRKRKSAPSPTPPPPAPAGQAAATAPRRDLFHERIPLTPESMRSSLERSLQALGTDHLDILFLHEPMAEISRFEDLAAEAAELKSRGKIRAWGLAFDSRTAEIHAPLLARVDIRQFDLSPAAPHYENARRSHADSANVFFSPLRHRGTLEPAAALGRLWQDFPRSVVLCSMFSPDHLRSNAAAAGA
jgi:aryl-alcohol dehydrogenase-like predicted oxidoreductase